MSALTTQPSPTGHLGHLDTRLVGYGAVGGLLGGLVLFVQMAIYNGVMGMGFWSIPNSCFAAFVFPEAGMGVGDGPVVGSHLAVGALLLRAGLRMPANPAAYVAAAMVGGALLFVIMMHGVAPVVNPEIVESTPRTPFVVGHLLFGATVGAFAYWRCVLAGLPATVAAQ